MSLIDISEEQFNNFIKAVEDIMYNVIVNDTFEFYHMFTTFTGLTTRQEMAIYNIIENELIKLVEESNKDKVKELSYNMLMALESAAVGLGSLNKRYNYTADEIYNFCKDTFHWLLGIEHSPSMFESLFNVTYPDDNTDEQNPSNN